MKAIFIMGLPHSGKTTFRQYLDFPADNIIDVFDIQSLFRQALEGPHGKGFIGDVAEMSLGNFALECTQGFHNGVVVFEFVGVEEHERKFYIDIVRECDPKASIVGFFLETDEKTRKARLANNQSYDSDSNKDKKYNIERPSLAEGFSALFFVRSDGVKERSEHILEQATWHTGYIGNDVTEAQNSLRQWIKGEKPVNSYLYAGHDARALAAELATIHSNQS